MGDYRASYMDHDIRMALRSWNLIGLVSVLSLAKINSTSRDRKNFGNDNNTRKSTPNELKM